MQDIRNWQIEQNTVLSPLIFAIIKTVL